MKALSELLTGFTLVSKNIKIRIRNINQTKNDFF